MNQKRTKKVMTLDEFIAEETKSSAKDQHAKKYANAIGSARGTNAEEKLIDDLKLKVGKFSLRNKILKNPWVNARPATKASTWVIRDVLKDPKTYKYNKRFMHQGGLFMFEYLNPKYKDTDKLPWFDKYPLVISLGPVATSEGIRNIGFNLHLLPPKIRIIVLCQIFELYKRLYRYMVFYKQTDKPIQIAYQSIIKKLDKYGVRFCVRMYIPARQRQVVRFPITDWHKAIFIPSRGYDSIRAEKLINEWKVYCRNNKQAGNANINWQSII